MVLPTAAMVFKVIGKRASPATIQNSAKVGVPSYVWREVRTIGFSQGIDPGVSVLLARLAIVIPMAIVQSRLLCHELLNL